jgi:hypothetical protein
VVFAAVFAFAFDFAEGLRQCPADLECFFDVTLVVVVWLLLASGVYVRSELIDQNASWNAPGLLSTSVFRGFSRVLFAIAQPANTAYTHNRHTIPDTLQMQTCFQPSHRLERKKGIRVATKSAM